MKIDIRKLNKSFEINGNLSPFIDTKDIFFDTRNTLKNGIFFPIKGENFDAEEYKYTAIKKGASCFFSTKNLKDTNYYRILSDGKTALHSLASFVSSEYKGTKIGISGTSGKTSFKEMFSSILSYKYKIHSNSGNFNNLIGLPMSIFKLKGDEEFAVFELGTNQKGEIFKLSSILKPDISVITNIGLGHTEFLGDREGVFQEKKEIILNTKKCFFTNGDEIYYEKLIDYAKSKNVFSLNFKTSEKILNVDLENGTEFELKIGQKQFNLNSKIFGLGNIKNLSTIVGIILQLDLMTFEEIKIAMSDINIIKNRLFPIKINSNTFFINDTYNSNPLSLKNGIEFCMTLDSYDKYAVIGDMLEINEKDIIFSANQIYDLIAKSNIKFIFYGNNIKLFFEYFSKKGFKNIVYFPINQFEDVVKYISSIITASNNLVFYFKASRGIKMEKIMEKLKYVC